MRGRTIVFLALLLAAIVCGADQAALAQQNFIRGDADCDGDVDNDDLDTLAGLVFNGRPIACNDAGDLNDNGSVTSSDFIYLQQYLGGGSPPLPPFPNCGQDPTPDGLTCASECCNTLSHCDSVCHFGASFAPTSDTTIQAGWYEFCDFQIGTGITVDVAGPCTLNVVREFRIDQGGLLRAGCTPLIINIETELVMLSLVGSIVDTCPSANDSGGTLVLRSVGSMALGGNSSQTQARIEAADIFIGDPQYAPRPEPDTVVYEATGETDMTNLSPMANVRATYLGNTTFDIEMIELSLTGGPLQRTLYLGSGDSVVNPPPIFQYTYSAPGDYRVVYSVSDLQGNTIRPSLVLSVPNGTILQGHVSPFVPSSLVATLNQPASFHGEAPADCASAEWDFGEVSANAPDSQFSFAQPGTHIALYTYTTETGAQYEAQVPIYVKLEGAQSEVLDPLAPNIPFPSCENPSQMFRRDPATHDTACAPCSLCTIPTEALGFPPGTPVIVMGNLELRSARIGGFLVTGFLDATIIIRPEFVVVGGPGAAGGLGQSGKPGGGYAQVTLFGEIVECGATYVVGPGGDGGVDAAGGCPAVTKGGRGGDAGSVALYAPFGSVSWCGNIELVGANGGNGGASGAFGNPVGACMNGCSAYSRGGRGGLGGGGLVALASAICYDSAYSVTFSGAATGGNGGYAQAIASDGGDCGICGLKGGDGGHGNAYGGRGGSSFFFFAMWPPPPISVLVGHLLPIGTWTGGNGANADALAGNGGNGTTDCCPELPGIDGGDGGFADAHGGRRGRGITANGLPGLGTALCGNGGNGSDGNPPGAAGAGALAHDDFFAGIPCRLTACPPSVPGNPCPCNVPPWTHWNPRWNFPDGFRFSLDDTTMTCDLYGCNSVVGQSLIRVLGKNSYGQLSGDFSSETLVWDGVLNKHISRGGIVILLDGLPGGKQAGGVEIELVSLSLTGFGVHLEGYDGGVKVLESIMPPGCAETTLTIQFSPMRAANALAALDSVILWGEDFSFDSSIGISILVPAESCPVTMTGDVNNNGSITSADIIYIVGYVFKGGPAPAPCTAAGDVNCNGTVTSADVIYLVNYVFKGGTAPCDVCSLIPGTWTCP